MKKSVLLVVFLLLTVCSFTQTAIKLRAYKGDYGVWNSKLKDFSFLKEAIPIDIMFYIDDEGITVNDLAKSSYLFLKHKETVTTDTYKLVSFISTDEKIENCTILFLLKDSQIASISVVYGDRCFIYYMVMKETRN